MQGVFYRATCAERARALGLSGWVRNTPEGTVEVVFEGDPEAVEAAISWCRRGPRGAAIAAVEVVDEPPIGEEGFRVTA